MVSQRLPILDEDMLVPCLKNWPRPLLETPASPLLEKIKPVSQDAESDACVQNIGQKGVLIGINRLVTSSIKNPWHVPMAWHYTLLDGKRSKFMRRTWPERSGDRLVISWKTKKSLVVATGQGAIHLRQFAGLQKMYGWCGISLMGVGHNLEVGDAFGNDWKKTSVDRREVLEENLPEELTQILLSMPIW